MNTKMLNSDPIVHSQTIQRMPQRLTERARQDIDKAKIPDFRRFSKPLPRCSPAAHRFSSLRPTPRESLESLMAQQKTRPHIGKKKTRAVARRAETLCNRQGRDQSAFCPQARRRSGKRSLQTSSSEYLIRSDHHARTVATHEAA
jgi:hypothetical protein